MESSPIMKRYRVYAHLSLDNIKFYLGEFKGKDPDKVHERVRKLHPIYTGPLLLEEVKKDESID